MTSLLANIYFPTLSTWPTLGLSCIFTAQRKQESQFAAGLSSRMASSSSSHLPPSAYNPRRHVGVHAERISDVASTEFPGHYPGEDHSWSLARFKDVSTSREYFSTPAHRTGLVFRT